MPTLCDSIIDSKPFYRHESEYTEMALKDIILPITQFGEGNIGTNDINVALGDVYTSNMISYREEKIVIAVPVYNHTLEEVIPCVDGIRIY
tara:strand:+ start:1969 stop:2241 length:273 start_codon:yes stop_codon:yes gene_type:complete